MAIADIYNAVALDVYEGLERDYPYLHGLVWHYSQMVYYFQWNARAMAAPPFLRVDVRADDEGFLFWMKVELPHGYAYDTHALDRLVEQLGTLGGDGLAQLGRGRPPVAPPPFGTIPFERGA